MDDTVTICAGILGTAATIGGFAAGGIMHARWDLDNIGITNKSPWPRRIAACWILGLTAMLWSPWLSLGLVKIYRANWNAVNYVNRPDVVTPVPGRVYRADEAVLPAPMEKP